MINETQNFDKLTGRFLYPVLVKRRSRLEIGYALWEKYYAWSPYHYSRNNPVNASDGNGHVVDTFLDIAFIAYDIYDIGSSYYNTGTVGFDEWGALGADIIGAAVPFATGGGKAVKAAFKSANAVDATKVISKVDDVIDAEKTIKKHGN